MRPSCSSLRLNIALTLLIGYSTPTAARVFSSQELAQCKQNTQAVVAQKAEILRYARLSSDVYDHYDQASRTNVQTQSYCAAPPGAKVLLPADNRNRCTDRAQLYKFDAPAQFLNLQTDFGAEVRLNCLEDTCAQPIEVIFRGTAFKYDVSANIKQGDGALPDYYRQAADLVKSIAHGYPHRRVVVTGHSLGGGMALYAAQGVPNAFAYVFNPAGLHRVNVFDETLRQRSVSFVAYDSRTGKTDPLDAVNRKLEPYHVRFNTIYVPEAPTTKSDVDINSNNLHSIDRLIRGIADNLPRAACSDMLGYTPDVNDTMDVATIEDKPMADVAGYDMANCPKEVPFKDPGRWFPDPDSARQVCANPQMLPNNQGGFSYWCASRVVPGPYCGAYYEDEKDAAKNCQNPDYQPVGGTFRYYCYPRKLRGTGRTYFAFEKDARKECKNPEMYMFNVYFCRHKK